MSKIVEQKLSKPSPNHHPKTFKNQFKSEKIVQQVYDGSICPKNRPRCTQEVPKSEQMNPRPPQKERSQITDGRWVPLSADHLS